jgi:hypothetical protein
VAGCCECGDEPSGSCATELVSLSVLLVLPFYHLHSFVIVIFKSLAINIS